MQRIGMLLGLGGMVDPGCSCFIMHARYLQCPDDSACEGSRLVAVEEPCQPEIGDLWVHVGVQQDVAGLEITVHDLDLRVLVEVQQTSRCSVDYKVPCLPS